MNHAALGARVDLEVPVGILDLPDMLDIESGRIGDDLVEPALPDVVEHVAVSVPVRVHPRRVLGQPM